MYGQCIVEGREVDGNADGLRRNGILRHDMYVVFE